MSQSLENARGALRVLNRREFVVGFDRATDNQIVITPGGNELISRRALPTRGELQVTLVKPDRTAALTALDDLLRLLAFPPLKFRHGVSGRYLMVWPEGADDSATIVARAPIVRVPLVAPDPRWVGANKTESKSTSSSTSFSVTVEGSAATRPIIKLSGNGAKNPKLKNNTTGQEAQYLGQLGPGQTLELDCERTLALIGAAGALDNMSNTYLLGGFALVPGQNNLALSSEGNTVNLTLTWTERWS